MPVTTRSLITPSARGRSREVASFFAQLDELSGRMFADLSGVTPAELAWQPVPGRNTLGMLLAHCAGVEAWWLAVSTVPGGVEDWERQVLSVTGIGIDDDGMPLPRDGRPPRALRGRTLAGFRTMHDRARRYARRAAAAWSDADLSRPFRRVRANGSVRVLNARWVLYHVLEHQAGHYGQMLLIRHEYRDRRRRAR